MGYSAIKAVALGLRDFYNSSDVQLLELSANERSITHRLANYLEEYFPGFDVDCEYNRVGSSPKRIRGLVATIETSDMQAQTVYPDIIVHKRDTMDHNYIVIEVKKAGNNTGNDIDKLKIYLSELKYKHAFMIVLFGNDPKIEEIVLTQIQMT